MNLTNTSLNESSLNEVPSSNDTLNETTIIIEPQISINITNETSSESSPILDSINTDLNLTESSVEINNTEEMNIPTTTTATPTLNNNDGITPIISSPWLKGMLINTKSLPELFKIIEKLNFNLSLSNRYLQELSQHYVYEFFKNVLNKSLLSPFFLEKNLMKLNKQPIYFSIHLKLQMKK